MSLKLRLLNSRDADFKLAFDALLDRTQSLDPAVEATVREIVEAVRTRGDAAVLDYTSRFDRREVKHAGALEIPLARLDDARAAIGAAERQALEAAADRIRRYHERQRIESWQYAEADRA